MKFEEMKKIWDEQNNEHMYVINETRLRATIEEKKKKASGLVNKMEWMLIGTNTITGIVVLSMNFIKSPGGLYPNLLAFLMLGMGAYIMVRRVRRLKHEHQFDRTMLGDLEHAISNATYKERLSFGMLLYLIPVFILVLLNAVQEGKSMGVIMLILVFFVVIAFLGRWEHRSWHVAYRKRLEGMKAKLTE